MTSPSLFRIATRASRLAMWQANHVAALLVAAHPQATIEIVHVTTIGDHDQSEPLRAFGGVGVFTREVQKGVLEGRADLAVHSLKDLPTESVDGLTLAAIPIREDPADALVLPESSTGPAEISTLRPEAHIGTGSPRRQAQLLHLRADFQLSEVRGNVETRLQKLDAGGYDALILAVAGLKRLGLERRISRPLGPPVMYPAVGQGALGIECRSGDARILECLAALDDAVTRDQVTAERSLLARLQAGCHAPVGVATCTNMGELVLEAVVLSPDGRQRLQATARASASDARSLGQQVADDLLSQGADRLIRQSG